ncbi:MAG: hypothetical protein U9N45_06910, partial [Gemmatimonadota bacterium]|nr:hypothetical protein [Gemmatimonadota bacterium]
YPEPPPACQGLSVDDIISSLTFLAENRDLWGKIGRKNRDWVKRHHSLPLVTGRLLEIYRELMEVP